MKSLPLVKYLSFYLPLAAGTPRHRPLSLANGHSECVLLSASEQSIEKNTEYVGHSLVLSDFASYLNFQ